MQTRAVVIMLVTHALFLQAVSPMKNWNSLLKSNEKFVKNHTFAQQRAPLKNRQSPSVIVLSCADSRVTPELIFNQKLGSLFVVRVAGQVVDDVVVDSIEFAVANFNAHMIVVLGHSDCGAVAGALKHLQESDGVIDKSRGHLNAVLIPIETAIKKANINLQDTEALEKSIQANIKYVMDQLIHRSNTIAEAIRTGQLIVIGAEYSLSTGKVQHLCNIPQDVPNT